MAMRYLMLAGMMAMAFCGQAQLGGSKDVFTREDSLRGMITPERAWWDLQHYDLTVMVQPAKKAISGKNIIKYKVVKAGEMMQIDLQDPLELVSATQDGEALRWERDGKNVYFIALSKAQTVGKEYIIELEYRGKPKEAINAPWDGGFSWGQDKEKKPFIATSCQGLGASVWWPCKDHMYDEPDKGMDITLVVPDTLVGVSNGRLIETKNLPGGLKSFKWRVTNPINNYGVNANIGNYTFIYDTYQGEKGELTLQYYVLATNAAKAKVHFEQVKPMLKAFEHWFGAYPFYEDGYKLVEVPYLGMEHQSSVTYGNKYMNGYLGQDLSGSGWGKKFDYIIVHESGHEWFANNITYEDIADMWIHESFTTYSECLYVEYHYGKAAGAEYVTGMKKNISNDKPIIGTYNVNEEGSGDMYYKGANILHTLRQLLEDDQKWQQILRDMNKDFYHQIVTGKQIEDYLVMKTKIPLQEFFEQYLRTTMIPKLETRKSKKGIEYRYTNIIKGFDMPVQVTIDGKEQWIYPKAEWQEIKCKKGKLVLDPDFLVEQ
jgi:aminopeptidase N